MWQASLSGYPDSRWAGYGLLGWQADLLGSWFSRTLLTVPPAKAEAGCSLQRGLGWGRGERRQCKGRRIAESDRRFPFFKAPTSGAQTEVQLCPAARAPTPSACPSPVSLGRCAPCLLSVISPLFVTPPSAWALPGPPALLCSADTLLLFFREESTRCQRASLALSSLHDIASPGPRTVPQCLSDF